MKSIYTIHVSPIHAAQADVCCFGGEYWITRIIVPRPYRRQGYGNAVLKMVLADADAEGVKLILEAQPYDPTFSKRKLVAWYERHGFKRTPFGVLERLPCSSGLTSCDRKTQAPDDPSASTK